MTSVCCTPGCLGSASEAVSDHEPWVHRGGVHDQDPPPNPGPGRPRYTGFRPRWMRGRTEADGILDGCPATGVVGPAEPGDPLAMLVSALSPDERRRLADMLRERNGS